MPNTKNKFKYGFINQALFYQITPTFAKVKGHFGSLKDKYNAEKSILVSQLVDHKKHLKKLCISRMVITTELKNKVGFILYQYICSRVLKSLRHVNIMQL